MTHARSLTLTLSHKEREQWSTRAEAPSVSSFARCGRCLSLASLSLLVLCLWLVPAVLPANAASGGTVVVWGSNNYGLTNVPAGLSGVTAIAAGAFHIVALKSDGTVVAWGYNASGQTTVPAGLNGVTAIDAGVYHTMAVKSDGTVVAWGDNLYGKSTPPVGLSGVVAISGGNSHTVALKSDGTVVAWGGNYQGQTTGTPTKTNPYTATANPVTLNGGVLSGVTAIAAGAFHTVALKSSGTLVAWGASPYGETNVPTGLSGVTAIAAGGDDGNGSDTLALKSDGTMVAWGGWENNFYGEATVPAGLNGVTAIAAGSTHTVALKNDGKVVAWGNNRVGQTNVPTALSGVTAIAAGNGFSVALVGVTAPIINLQPQSLTVAQGSNAIFTVTAIGTAPLAYQWFFNSANLFGATNSSLTLTNVQLANVGAYSVVVTNAAGSTNSLSAMLTVLPAPPSLSFHRLDSLAMDVSSTDTNDAPVQPVAFAPTLLANQPPLGQGAVADGVTPVLLRFRRNVAAQAASYQLDLSINGLVLNDVVRSRLRVLANGAWTPGGSTMTVNFAVGQTDAFAFIEGIPMEQAVASTVGGVLTVTANVKDGTTVVNTQSYQVRRPPVVLVHGYNTDKSSWVSPFTNILDNVRPGFVFPVGYGSSPDGKGGLDNSANTYLTLEANAYLLDQALRLSIEDPNQTPLRDWFFLRYDVVAHSQGGVLARMLCRKGGSYEGDTAWFSRKYPRGRFHRVITIGSIHNGSVIPYYLTQLAPTSVRFALPLYLRYNGILQPKFDPFGPQIQALNGALVDERARFHCIRTSVDFNGNVAPAFALVGLGPERRAVLLPFGSDGVVDLESQGGGAGTHGTTILGENISHSEPLWFFGGTDWDTHSATVASRVNDLLEGPASNFGRFINPVNLSADRKSEIDQNVPLSIFTDLIFSSVAPQSIRPQSIALAGTTNTYNFQMQTLPGDAAQGSFNWTAEVLSEGLTNQTGVTVMVNTNDSRLVSVLVDSTVVGDVVLYGSYTSTNGTLVLGKPKLVVSIPAGTVLSGVELRPNGVPLLLSNSLPLEVWGDYTNGARNPLFFAGNPQFVFSNLTPSVVTVDTNGVLFGVGPGTGTVQVTYQGVSSQATFTVIAPPSVNAHPLGQVTGGGSNVTLNAAVAGTGLTYQWYRDGVALAGATNLSLTLTNSRRADGGIYSLNINNAVSTLVTSNALVRVRVPQSMRPPERLGNGQFRLLFNDQDGGPPGTLDLPFLEVQVSTNLSSTNWTVLTNAFTLTNGMVQFDDVESTNGLRRFYRVIER